MILYTPMCPYEVFSSHHEAQKLIDISYKGKIVSCFQHENGQYEIVKLHSTNPEDYLNKTFHPGVLFYNPSENK